MPVIIKDVQKNSQAHRLGIRGGDALLSVNGHGITDVLDYRFYIRDETLALEIESNGIRRKLKLRKNEDDDIGLEFDSYLMDSQRRCKNSCIFCFIDQLPKGMRGSLYFKDDDSRLSFLFGNYITLTNLTEHEISRIITMRISPVNISVHTMDPELRNFMMGNKWAGESLCLMDRFAEAGIKMNVQLVLCPGINDGGALTLSLERLAGLYPAVQSAAAVPVGLTRHREGLYPLKGYDESSARAVVDAVNAFGDEFYKEHGTRLAFSADEFFIKAKLPFPNADYYEDFAQLENGVGMASLLREEFLEALAETETEPPARQVSIATGAAAYDLIRGLIDEAAKKWHNLNINIFCVPNRFFGESVTVSGLLTGRDLIEGLRDKNLGERLLIPANTLKSGEDIFLDSMTLAELEDELKVKVTAVPCSGAELVDAIMEAL